MTEFSAVREFGVTGGDEANAPPLLSEPQQRALLTRWHEIDRLMEQIEAVLSAKTSTAVFPKFKSEVSPPQARVIADYIANIRAELIQSAKALGVDLPPAEFSPLHSINISITFAEIAMEECTPEKLEGYGELDQRAVPQIRGMVEQLLGSLGKLRSYIAAGADLGQRLEKLANVIHERGDPVELLRRIVGVIDRRGIVEFRPTVTAILDRLEKTSFEIALFGRVSSGKSSLLNRLLGVTVLPVGVTPVTAIPTRLIFGDRPLVKVSFSTGRKDVLDVGEVVQFVSEQHNRANHKQVTRIVVELPSQRLVEGIVFVDTPGLGSLAAEGAAETMAYLPRCDMGVVLIDSASTLTEGDLTVIRMLTEAGIPASVLLSKADLNTASDQQQAIEYTRDRIRGSLGLEIPIHSVSVAETHAHLIESWFSNEIAPLYKRHRELARKSIARKISLLCESVESSLRLSLRRETQGPSEVAVRRAAATLREATGRFDTAWRQGLNLIDHLRSAGPRMIAQVAEEALDLARANEAPSIDGGWVRSAIQRIVLEATRDLPKNFAVLAAESTEALSACASDLNRAQKPSPNELGAAVQEMPLVDVGTLHLPLHVGFLRRMWRRFAIRAIAGKLTESIGGELARILSAYCSVLQQWANSVQRGIRERFDIYAEPYRAAILHLGGASDTGTRPMKHIESDLAELRSTRSTEAPVT